MNVRHTVLALTMLTAAFATACGGTPPAVATATNAPPASASPTSTATAAATPTPALPLPSGEAIPPIVAQVIGAVTSKQIASVLPLVAYQNVGCTTAQGAGGPPKCKPGEAQGTVQKVFPTGRCEGEWASDATKAITDAVNGAGSLYAAAKVKAPSPDPEPYWPKGETVVVFRGISSASPTAYFVLSGDKIVRAHLACDPAAGGEDALIKNLGGSAYYVAPTTSTPDTSTPATPPAAAPTSAPTASATPATR